VTLFKGCRGLWQGVAARLADLNDAGHLHDRGLFLPFSKSSGLSMNCIGSSKPLTVLVKHSHLPVMVLAPCVLLD
jgi:hypothetical protein